MLALGIDPGTALMGYGLIKEENGGLVPVAYGCIKTKTQDNISKRLLTIYQEIQELLVTHQPDCLVFESLFFNKNTRTAVSIGQAQGVVLLAAAGACLPVFEYTPLQVKQAVASYGRASKRQIQQMVQVLLHLPEVPRPDDVADALAVTICHLHAHRLRQLVVGN